MAFKIAYQVYSSRNFPPLIAQFPLLKAMGYDAIEPWLPAYEADPKVLRQALDDTGLVCYGFHMPLKGLVEEPGRFAEIALTLGARWMIPPWISAEERGPDAAAWRLLGERLGAGAEAVKAYGQKVAWHNHDFEFVPLADGTRPIDHIFAAAGPDVCFEIDCGWIVRAGANPAAELAKFADRITIIQTKDTAPPGTRADDGWTATGDGIIDWAALAPLFRETNAEHLVTEHDNPSDWQTFAKRSINHLRRLGL